MIARPPIGFTLGEKPPPRLADSGPGYRGSVSTRAYEAYHDLGHDHGGYLDSPEEGTTAVGVLTRFHARYEATDYASPAENCRRTDDKVRADGVYEARSNRSQFSFVTNVVDHGISGAAYSQVTAVFTWAGTLVTSRAYAEGHRLRERRVEIKPYQTAGGIACIPFKVNTRGVAQVLRVNDLDRRNQFGFDWARAPEFRVGPTDGGEP